MKSTASEPGLNLLFHWSPLICTSILFRDRGIVMSQSLLFSQPVTSNLSNRCRLPNSIKDLTATWGSAIRQNLGWKCGLGKKTIFGIVMTKVRSVGFSRERSENAGSKAPLSKTLLNNTYIGKQ